jgi:putative IMPACT (imprinted ancient) family translation regulator
MTGAGDDGEPAGTAGRPMLKVLLNSGIGDVVGVVARWFGGVKLGTGGLVRAYSGGVQRALRAVEARERVDEIDAFVVVAYAQVDAVRRMVAREGARITGESFAEVARLTLRVPEDRVGDVNRALADLTNGAVQLER